MRYYSKIFSLVIAIFITSMSGVAFGDPILFQMEGGSLSKTDTYADPVWDTITLNSTYVNPVIFIIPRNDGGHSADFRLQNITPNSFEATVVEPPGYDGPHIAMTVSYVVAEKGYWFLTPDRVMAVGTVDTNDLVNSAGGTWTTVPIPQGFTNPIIIAQIQGMANEMNNLPSEISKPWFTVAVRNVTSTSFEVSLDGGRCTNLAISAEPDCVGPYTLLPETIGWLAIEGNVQNTFDDADGKSITLETILTGPGYEIIGWSDSGTSVSFGAGLFTQPPLFVAKPQTRNEDDGGWFRFSSLTNTSLILLVEEAVGDMGVRNHLVGEQAGLLAFSENFRVQDLDPDKDFVPIPNDNCPFISNEDQADIDSNGVGDACDCGDGIVAVSEYCDDGNLIDDDGCSSICGVETGYECYGNPSVCDGYCGDGIMIGSEVCDDGNINDDPACSSDCSSYCGDSTRNADHGEDCDGVLLGGYTCLNIGYGFSDGVLGCAVDCQFDVSGCTACGNSIVETGEDCDDGNPFSGDGCTGLCVIESGWECQGEPSTCDSLCGDGFIKGSELCDDGNTTVGDGCSDLCVIELGWSCLGEPSSCDPVCGDGVIMAGELCDDGNMVNSDGCSDICAVETGWACFGQPSVCDFTCGNGTLDGNEECDDSNNDNSDGCSAGCVIEPGWRCTGEPSQCEITCGNNTIEENEECDDGNTDDADGCSFQCEVEDGWSCTGEPSQCEITCGNGIVDENEECDDSNWDNEDGCTGNCKIETGWLCEGEPSQCEIIPDNCGDGLVSMNELCDDDNVLDGDGCSSICEVEEGWLCSGAPSDCCIDSDSDGVCDQIDVAPGGSGCSCSLGERNRLGGNYPLIVMFIMGLFFIRRFNSSTHL
jgi:cysteine-rich repeat protein